MRFDPIAQLRLLVEHDVEFVVVGGMAGIALGATTATFDLDVCYARDQGNLERLTAALYAMGARLRGVAEDVPFPLDAKTLKAGQNFTFSTDLGPFDILGLPSGTDGFDDLSRDAVDVDVDGVRVRVVSLDSLLRMKRAADRPKDRAAVQELLALRERRGED